MIKNLIDSGSKKKIAVIFIQFLQGTVSKNMLKHKLLLYCAIIFLTRISLNFTNDIYSKFHQDDYKIEFQRIELIDYNKSVLNFFKIKTFKYNRTQPVANITFNSKVNMSNEVEVAIQFYKFLSNEYRKLPGSYFQVNVCRSLELNLVGMQIIFKCGNVTACQIVQETTYIVCNIYPDESRFPPLIPSGEYRFKLDGIYHDEIIASANVYLKIYRPIRTH